MRIDQLLATKSLTVWERNFLHGIAFRENLTPRQQQTLRKIETAVQRRSQRTESLKEVDVW